MLGVSAWFFSVPLNPTDDAYRTKEGLRVCKVSAENPVRLQTAPTGFGTEAIIFLKLTPMERFATAPVFTQKPCRLVKPSSVP